MAVIGFLVSISVLIAHAQDFRSLTEADMKELGVQSAKSLQGCASTLALDDASNLTSEAVDKNVLLKNVSEAYQAAHLNVDSKSDVVGKFKIKSSTSESKNELPNDLYFRGDADEGR